MAKAPSAPAKKSASKKPAKSRTAATKKPAAKSKPAAPTTSKRRFRLRRRRYEKRELAAPLSNVYRLFMDSLEILRVNWRVFSRMLLVYVVLSIVLVGTLNSGLLVSQLRSQLDQVSNGGDRVQNSFVAFGEMLGTAGGASSEVGSTYQSMIVIVMSLAIIWALRRIISAKPVTMRDAFYRGMTPLVPFILVLLVIGIQLIPMFVGGTVYNIVFTNGLAEGGFEKTALAVLVFVLVVVSLYLVCSSLFALYIVTLPGMRPMAALRSARGLVRYRRWTILRKLLFLPIALLVIGAVICIPLFIWVAPVAPFVFLLLTMVALFVTHAYMYNLYRELL